MIFDREGNYPGFIEYFHLLVARSMNTRWKRRDSFWSASQTSVVWLPDVASIVDKLVYTFTNPTKHLVVDRIEHWPGANGFRSLLSGETVCATRPTFFFQQPGKKRVKVRLPAEVELAMVVPPELGDADAFRARVSKAVDTRLLELAHERANDGTRCNGLRLLDKVTWQFIPQNPIKREDRNDITPTYASKDPDHRQAAFDMRAQFLRRYRRARRRWLGRQSYVFPIGTYALARFARVRVRVPLIDTPVVLMH
ncbi:MAG TPA: hypothetical protein VFQ53_03205 [Kofleriaceae bacterium]|nr:hypothetical protein [Kofleriaceae bacterium]